MSSHTSDTGFPVPEPLSGISTTTTKCWLEAAIIVVVDFEPSLTMPDAKTSSLGLAKLVGIIIPKTEVTINVNIRLANLLLCHLFNNHYICLFESAVVLYVGFYIVRRVNVVEINILGFFSGVEAR